MKLNTSITKVRGIAMTEYLIILAIVAIASIVVVRAYGSQVKTVVVNSIDAMAGRNGSAVNINSPVVVDSGLGDFSKNAAPSTTP